MNYCLLLDKFKPHLLFSYLLVTYLFTQKLCSKLKNYYFSSSSCCLDGGNYYFVGTTSNVHSITMYNIFNIYNSSVFCAGCCCCFKFNKYIRHLPPLVLQCTIDCPVVCRVSFFLFIILGILIKYRKQALGGFRYFIF